MTPDLGPLPDMAQIDRHIPTNIVIRGYTADQLRAERERCYALGVAAERARIIAELHTRHEADKHRHNYWACFARELEGG